MIFPPIPNVFGIEAKMAEERKGLNLKNIFGAVTDFLIPILQKTTTQAVAQLPSIKKAGTQVAEQRAKDVIWKVLPIAGVGILALILIKKL